MHSWWTVASQTCPPVTLAQGWGAAGCGTLRASRLRRHGPVQHSPRPGAPQNQSDAGKEQKPSWGQGLCSALGAEGYEGDQRSPGPILQGFGKTQRRREWCAGRGGWKADRSPSAVTFHSFKCLGFLQISSGFPGAFLFFSNYRGLQLALADPCACKKYHCCQPDLQVCAGIITGLGLKVSLGDCLPLIFDAHAQRWLHLQEAFSLGTP